MSKSKQTSVPNGISIFFCKRKKIELKFQKNAETKAFVNNANKIKLANVNF